MMLLYNFPFSGHARTGESSPNIMPRMCVCVCARMFVNENNNTRTTVGARAEDGDTTKKNNMQI